MNSREAGALSRELPILLSVLLLTPQPSLAPPRGQPPPESLQPLSRFFASARSRYLRAPQAEARDVPLLLEAEALVHQALASAHQLKADSFYREALKALEGQKESTRAKSQKVRLLYKLRDFDGARTAGRELSRKS